MQVSMYALFPHGLRYWRVY
ncbi:hypothetical protein F383_31558 [Gossypium arboreum]|uniref:Uncharacterized protein n=1 Tax=Gossypium arboreum TaxID=29729 RepID=A0A0B0MXP3_GOSAR|nr:hypothetical protein F383_31558 [Gossypium arboreum]